MDLNKSFDNSILSLMLLLLWLDLKKASLIDEYILRLVGTNLYFLFYTLMTSYWSIVIFA